MAIEVNCPATAARITTTTTGLDIDPSGYHIVVNGTDRGGIPSNGMVLTRLDPGSSTIALTGLAPNCTPVGDTSRAVTVADPEVVPIEFAVVCTATSGVIGIVVEVSGRDLNGVFEATLDGGGPFPVGPDGPHYLSVFAGNHVISLLGSDNCSVETGPQTVTVTVGELIRDTVEVSFSVTCVLLPETYGIVRITAVTTGLVASSTRYAVWDDHFGKWDYGGYSNLLGAVDPNGTLVTEVPSSSESGGDPYWYGFELRNIPANCSVQNPQPNRAPGEPGFTITPGDTLDLEFAVSCPP